MAEFEKNIPPKIYHTNDEEGIIQLWKDMVEQVVEGERTYSLSYQEIVDPDSAPIDFVELMLASLGNPFNSVYLTETQKRKLVKLLIPIYRQKGVAKGIENSVRFITGLEVEIIDPHGIDGWEIGHSFPVGSGGIGLGSYAGGRRSYKNMLDYSEDFDNAVWDLTNATVDPETAVGPAPWGRTADTIDMTSAGATILQSATPRRMAGEWFTGSIWLKASSAGTISGVIRAANNPSIDITSTTLSVTTEWQRFEFQHQCLGGASGDIEFALYSASGFAPTLYAFGAQLVRDDYRHPYFFRTDDGVDEWELGAWGYHFFIQSPDVLTNDQDRIIRLCADFVKPAHTHYTLISEEDLGFIDHWEVGLSEIGLESFVHS